MNKLPNSSKVLGWVSGIVGILVLTGWKLQFLPLLKLYPMRYASAICFVVCGMCVATMDMATTDMTTRNARMPFAKQKLFSRHQRYKKIIFACQMIGLLLVFLIGSINVYYDLFSEFTAPVLFGYSTKMSTASGFLFCLLAAIIFNNLLQRSYAFKVNLWLVFLGLFTSFLGITAYLLDYHILSKLQPLFTIAPLTAITFAMLFLAAFFALKDNPMVSLVSAASLGGTYARTLLPVSFLFPVFLGIILLGAVKVGIITIEASFVVLAFLSSLVITTIVYKKSKVVHFKDFEKQIAYEDANILNQQLGKVNSGLKSLVQELKENNQHLLAEKESLVYTNETLDAFVHAASHDLKSPVQHMKAIYHMIDIEQDESKKKQYLSVLEASTVRLEDTINGLMGLVALQSTQEGDIERINFHQLLKLVLEDCPLKPTDQLCISFDKAPYIHYIKTYLQSILRNLISNASKYRNSERNLLLKVTTERKSGKVILKVEDNGIGIDMVKFGHLLFHPFKRFSNQASGSGIGLHLIKSMIEKNGGSLHVKSKLRQGTTFYCELIEY